MLLKFKKNDILNENEEKSFYRLARTLTLHFIYCDMNAFNEYTSLKNSDFEFYITEKQAEERIKKLFGENSTIESIENINLVMYKVFNTNRGSFESKCSTVKSELKYWYKLK